MIQASLSGSRLVQSGLSGYPGELSNPAVFAVLPRLIVPWGDLELARFPSLSCQAFTRQARATPTVTLTLEPTFPRA